MIKDKTVFIILDRNTDEVKGSYNRAYTTDYEFSSALYARSSHGRGIYEDTKKYRIAEYKVTYTLVDGDVGCTDDSTN